jgi:hypothetical protein
MRTRVQSVGGTLSTRLYRDLQLCHLFPFFSALSFLYSLNSCFYDLRCSSDLVSFYVTHPKTEHHASDVESHRVRLVGARGNGIRPIWSRAMDSVRDTIWGLHQSCIRGKLVFVLLVHILVRIQL